MVLLQGLNAVRLANRIPRGVDVNMELFIARAPEPQISIVTEEARARILGAPAPAQERGRAPADRPARGGDVPLRRAEEDERRAAAERARLERERATLHAAHIALLRPITDPFERDVDNLLAASLGALTEHQRALETLIWDQYKTFNREVAEKVIALDSEQHRASYDALLRLSSQLALLRLNSRLATYRTGYVVEDAEREAIYQRTMEVSREFQRQREQLSIARRKAADIFQAAAEADDINPRVLKGIQNAFTDLEPLTPLHDLFDTLLRGGLIELLFLTQFRHGVDWERSPRENVIANPQNWDDDLYKDREARALTEFLKNRIQRTHYSISWIEWVLQFAPESWYQHQEGDKQDYVSAFIKLCDMRVHVGDSVISGTEIVLVAFNLLDTDEKRANFLTELKEQRFSKECTTLDFKALLAATKIAINDHEAYLAPRDRGLLFFVEDHRVVNPFIPSMKGGVSFLTIAEFDDLNDFVMQASGAPLPGVALAPGERAPAIRINLTAAQRQKLAEKNLSTDDVKAIMKACFNALRADVLTRNRDLHDRDIQWEDVIGAAQFNFEAITPPSPDEAVAVSAYLNTLRLNVRDPGYAPPLTRADWETAHRANRNGLEVYEMINPMAWRLYQRYHYLLNKKRIARPLSEAQALAKLKEWIARIEAEGRADRNADNTRRYDLRKDAAGADIADDYLITRNNLLGVLEEAERYGIKIWSIPNPLNCSTKHIYGNIWNQRFGLEKNAAGVEVRSYSLPHDFQSRDNAFISLTDVINYINNRGNDVNTDNLLSLWLYLTILDGGPFCENGKMIRAILGMASLCPEFSYDTGAAYTADKAR